MILARWKEMGFLAFCHLQVSWEQNAFTKADLENMKRKHLGLLSHRPLKQWRGECWSTHHRRPLQKWLRACHRLTVRLLLGVTELQGIEDPHLNDKVSRHNIWEAISSENTAVSLSLFFSWPRHLPGLPSNHTSLPQTVWNSECLSNFAVCN